MSQKQWFAHLGISAPDCTENSKTLKWSGVFAPLRSTATISMNFVGDPIPGMIHIAMFNVVSATCAIRLRVFTWHYFPFLLQYYLVCSAGRKISFGMKQAFLNIYLLHCISTLTQNNKIYILSLVGVFPLSSLYFLSEFFPSLSKNGIDWLLKSNFQQPS